MSFNKYSVTGALTQVDGVSRYATCWVLSYVTVLDPAKVFARLRPHTQGVAASPEDSTNTGGVFKVIMLEPLGIAGDKSSGASPKHADELPMKTG